MKRRDFLRLGGGVALGWPLQAAAQQADLPVIGFLHSGAPEQNVARMNAFRKGLGDAGFVEGRNVTIEYRWAAGRNEALPELAADLIRRKVLLIATPGSTPAAVAAKAATASIPIVFGVGADPVALGLLHSINRPDGNATGITSLNNELVAKRLGVLHDLVPGAKRYFTLANPGSVLTAPLLKMLPPHSASASRFSKPPPIAASTRPLPRFRTSPAMSWCSARTRSSTFAAAASQSLPCSAVCRRCSTTAPMSRPAVSSATARIFST
jgi:putative ABC transport system substrate-binding protein